jgi:hypothetical protein
VSSRTVGLLIAGLIAFIPALSDAVELRATGDTFTDGATAERGVNKGALRTVRVRRSGPQVSLIQFDPAQIDNDVVLPAFLKLKVEVVNAAGQLHVHRVNGSWNERTVTHNTRPPISDPWHTFSISAADVGKVISVNVSDLVRAWMQNPATNFGLAISATGTSGQAYFLSREGGMAPVLSFEQRTADNEVTVAKSGGDYENPVDAARNAYSGDNWCQSPADGRPCRINIAPGIFVLPETLVLDGLFVVTGAGKGQTLLVADNGVTVAVANAATGTGTFGTTLSNLSIVNHQPGADEATGFQMNNLNAVLQGVAVSVAGAANGTGIGGTDSPELTDCDVTVTASQSTVGISAAVSIDMQRTRVSATGGALRNTGLEYDFPEGGIFATDSNVVAAGGLEAFAVSGSARWTGGEVTAIADDRAVGIGDRRDGVTVVTGARVIARAGRDGTAITLSTIRGTQRIVDSYLEGSQTGVWFMSQAGGLNELIRSQITGGQIAIRSTMEETGAAEISQVIARGAIAISIESDPMVVNIAGSVLAGQRNYGGSTMSCTDTYDENYEQLDSNCQ